MKTFRLFLCLTILAAVSCTPKNTGKTGQNRPTSVKQRFALPEIPSMITAPGAQAAYLAEHYWDRFDFVDTLDPAPDKTMEEAFARYLMILREVDPARAAGSVRKLMDLASGNHKLMLYLADQGEKYLNHPNSPIRNEALYEEFLKGILASKEVEPDRKVRFQHQFDMAQKNKPGTRATDFEYSLKNGRRSSLYRTPGKLLMLYFFNPGCHECEATKERILNSPIMKKLAVKGDLKILALYPDKDLELWNKHYAELPGSWIRAYDGETVIEDRELYDLKAIPTIYLLDSEKVVLLRDPVFEQLESYLESL